ncbi:MAG: EamA family transporter [Bdellovibrionales bacterium]|nr:EamA family transporter [Bdellovibrionales bacterium]
MSLYASIGLVSTRQQIIEIGLINYLWPGLIVLVAVPLFKYKANLFLPIGLVIAFAGVALSMTQGEQFSVELMLRNLREDTLAYFLALLGAISWAVYSNLSRLWGRDAGPEAVCCFITLTGVLVFPFRYLFQEASVFNWTSAWQLLYMALVPTFLAYVLWDGAMKRGNIILVATLSFFTPLIATAMSWFILELTATYLMWIACGLVLTGSLLTKNSIVD